ncbi:TPR repeat-containing protein [Methanohalobium evestigatum Z-7303]|uniref:TPR repeat-containing protein n=1 Tax=Methanohalobium evestigatum (strain ATCC BAA-1072 / DSM 3721 / NBRC 107634 / OCM 161 / Z-7303) TaxID=644295 RepID=D7E7N1_METEZ|nr:tetratricopeptide repeat protein [Methanohalobium evestigatum]ADI74104.1 TPR repeat-containing protein [Methanohalobium evestigatum Z-7303]
MLIGTEYEDTQVTDISTIRAKAHIQHPFFIQSISANPFGEFQWLEDGLAFVNEEELEYEPYNIESLYKKMVTLELLGRPDEADEIAELIIELGTMNRRFLMFKAEVLSSKGRYEDAVELFEEAEKRDSPDDAPLAKAVHHIRYGEPEQAIEVCNDLLKWHQCHEVYYVRAYVYAVIGNLEQALEDIDTALYIRDELCNSWNFRGLIMEKMGDRKGAVESFKYALGIDSENTMATSHLAKL